MTESTETAAATDTATDSRAEAGAVNGAGTASPLRPHDAARRDAAPSSAAAPSSGAISSSPAAPSSPALLAASRQVTELAETLSDLLTHGPSDPLSFERALAGLVRARRENPAQLTAALSPVAAKGPTPQLVRDLPLATPLRQLHTVVVNAAWLPESARRDGRGGIDVSLLFLMRRLSLRLDRAPGMDPYALRSPADIITLRLAEIASRIGESDAVGLVSTPTHSGGWIDAATLVARIAAAEEAGRAPWQLDFDQALLRLEPDAGPDTVRAAHRLSSPAGHRLAGWLRGGRPTLPSARAMTAVVEPRAGSPRISPLTLVDAAPPIAPAPTTLIHLLRRGWYPPRPMADGSCWASCWPALLPGRPDLIAVAAAWHPRHLDTNGAACPTPLLTGLATPSAATAATVAVGGNGDLTPQPDAPADPGLLTAIARATTSRAPGKRADAAHALAALAVSGRLDPAAFAVALSRFAPRPDRQILRSVVPTLQLALTTASMNADGTALPVRKTAAAHRAIGAAVVGWLPAILPPNVEQPLPYTSHLLNLAADALTAAAAVRRVALPRTRTNAAALQALNLLADRPSRSSVPDAARRVLAALTR